MDTNQKLPDFETPASAPKRQRKAPAKKTKIPKKRSIAHTVKSISAGPGPKRARKKRPPRKLPRAVEGHQVHASTGPMLAPEGAAIIMQFNKLDETQRILVMNYIQAFR